MMTVYTDGSYQSSINAGGYAAVFCEGNDVVKMRYQGFKNTTNNRMELMGVITALKELNTDEKAIIVTDSQYICNNIPYAPRWFEPDAESRCNLDLWGTLLELLKQHPFVSVQWTKGHADNKGNNMADMLACHAAQCLNLNTDDYNNTEEDW